MCIVSYSRYEKLIIFFSNITDLELDNIVRRIKLAHPSAGYIIVQGHLLAKGIYVQRRRIRSAVQRVDPHGIENRSIKTIRRRVYSVPGPNFMWHIDGTHKLIRWRLVFHMGIDGFSRLIVFGQCSNNNRSSTVLTLFEKAQDKYGKPLRIRTDEGGENVKIWRKMQEQYPNRSNPVIVGSSVHNQRIERLHRDVNEQVANHFYNKLYAMESMGLLNPENITDLFCFHYVFIPLINKRLLEFILAHNNHKLSTEQNKTPLQLFYLYYHVRNAHTEANSEEACLSKESEMNNYRMLTYQLLAAP